MLPSDYVRAGWVKGTNAVDSMEEDVSPSDKEACKWCLEGAVEAWATSLPAELNPSKVRGMWHSVLCLVKEKEHEVSSFGKKWTVNYKTPWAFNDDQSDPKPVIELLEAAERKAGFRDEE